MRAVVLETVIQIKGIGSSSLPKVVRQTDPKVDERLSGSITDAKEVVETVNSY